MRALTEWDWPGNVRELGNVIARAVSRPRGRSLDISFAELRTVCNDEPRKMATPQGNEEIARIVKETIHALDSRKSVVSEHAQRQRAHIVRALTDSKGRVGGDDGAAARLGLNRTTLLSRMKKFSISAKQFC